MRSVVVAAAVIAVATPVMAERAKPALTAVSPASGDSEGGTYVVLEGKGYIKDGPRNAKVYFGSTQGTVVRFQNDTDLIVQAPPGKAGDVVDVKIVFDPGGTVTLAKAFTYVGKATLGLTAVEPDAGSPAGGTHVVLKGQRFIKDGPRRAKVTFGGRPAAVVRFQSDTDLIVQAPAGKAGDVVDVQVVFEPGGTLTLKKAFKYVADSKK